MNEHRAAIQKNFGSLVEQTDLDTMVSSLYERGVFSEQMIEPYQDQSKDARSRKRQLYMDITRRGPEAFGHLVDALTETGHWPLVRQLEPGSLPPRAPPRAHAHTHLAPGPRSNDDDYISINQAKKTAANNASTEKKEAAAAAAGAAAAAAPAGPPLPPSSDITDKEDVPKFNVIKSTKFMEDNGKDIKLYRTRGRLRGVLVVYSYVRYASRLEEDRRGADVDCQKLKYLFQEFGFKTISFHNLTKQETLTSMQNLLPEGEKGYESVFIVVSSHGYERARSWDTDFRCSDGGLISTKDVVDRFNNTACPALRGVPKVFVFQMCRGPNGSQAGAPAAIDGAPIRPAARPRARDPPYSERIYSDILIAHSTLPGNVSHRDVDAGSWYIQVLCEVFAAHAHHCHVETLFTLVDQALHKRFGHQTSDVQKWGFNSKLYLHPGLFED